MTLEELRRQLHEQIEAASTDVEVKRSALRLAEINLAFLQGQLHSLNQIRIEEQPIYSSGEENGHAP